MKHTLLIALATLALSAETKAYWWHQRFAPPISQTVVAGSPKEFIAVIASDKDEKTGGFIFTVRYRANGVYRVETRLQLTKLSRDGQTASAVFEVSGASEIAATATPAFLGVAAEAVGQ